MKPSFANALQCQSSVVFAMSNDLLISSTDVGLSDLTNSSMINIGVRQPELVDTSSLRSLTGMGSDHLVRAIVAFAIPL